MEKYLYYPPRSRIKAFQQPEVGHIRCFPCFSYRLLQIEREASSRIRDLLCNLLQKMGRNRQKLRWGKMGNCRQRNSVLKYFEIILFCLCPPGSRWYPFHSTVTAQELRGELQANSKERGDVVTSVLKESSINISLKFSY